MKKKKEKKENKQNKKTQNLNFKINSQKATQDLHVSNIKKSSV